MEVKAAQLTESDIRMQTSMCLARVTNALELAQKLTDDPERLHRLKAQECKACWYFNQFGGQAITTRPCAACTEVITWGNTNCPVLCVPCAKAIKLCRHCGSDIGLNPKRRKWPSLGMPQASQQEPKPATVMLLPKRKEP